MWTRLDASKLKNIGAGEDGDEDLALARRVYGQGSTWPRLVIAIYGSFEDPPRSVKIGIAKKEGPGRWWVDTDLPVELIGEVGALLHEAKSKLGA